MPTYKITLEYEGTRYSGWQAQTNTAKTVQGRLIAAATEAAGDIEIMGAGRTDAGVHAAAQVAHLRCRKALDPARLVHELNDRLPHDIHILRVERAPDRFHARHDAVARVYLYQISRRRTAFAKPFVWWIKDPLDARAMARAARDVLGRHDFGAFADRRLDEDESRVVVVDSCDVAATGDLILLRVAASHFLWKMVRKLVALFVEIGRGCAALDAIARRLAPGAERFEPTAPPSGLFLEAIVYPGESFDRPLAPIVPVVTR